MAKLTAKIKIEDLENFKELSKKYIKSIEEVIELTELIRKIRFNGADSCKEEIDKVLTEQ